MNRCDFRCVFKIVNVQDRRRSTGRLFHARGLATVKARSPMVERRVAGIRTSAVDAERSRRRESTSDSGLINSDKYCGAAPFRQHLLITIIIQTFKRCTLSTLKAEYEMPAVTRWVRTVTEIVVQTR